MTSFAFDDVENLFVAGTIEIENDQGMTPLAKFLLAGEGTLDRVWDPYPRGEVNMLLRTGPGVLLVGGGFKFIGGTGRSALAALPPIVIRVFADGYE